MYSLNSSSRVFFTRYEWVLFFYSLAACSLLFFYAPYIVNLVPCLFWICVDIMSFIKICPGVLLGFSDYCFPFVSLDYIIYFIFFCDFFF